jgi:hypothetical protein
MEGKKVIKERVLKITEYNHDDGSQRIKIDMDDFSEFEVLGLLKYFSDTVTVKMIKQSE